jgi:hypothetical protein
MDLVTGLSLVVSILATADLVYKYGSAIFEKAEDYINLHCVKTTFKKLLNVKADL